MSPSDRPFRTLRTIALFEALKGALVLGAGFGLLGLLHHDARHVAVALVSGLHLNPGGHRVGLFVEAAGRLTDARLWMLAMLAAVYALLHLAEAWGLWFDRNWARWLGVAAGGIYLPVEAWELAHKASVVKALVLVANLAVVVYLGWSLRRARQAV